MSHSCSSSLSVGVNLFHFMSIESFFDSKGFHISQIYDNK